MASVRALAERRALSVQRLEEIKNKLKKSLKFEVEEQPITNRDNDLAQVQQIENTVAVLEAIADAIAEKNPSVKSETKPAAK